MGDFSMLDRAIGLLGIALALIFGLWSLAPEGWPKMPPWLTIAGVAVGILLIGLAAGLIVGDRRGTDVEATEVNTVVRIQFYGDQQIPTEIARENIASWYALWSPSASVTLKDAAGNDVERHLFPKNWNIFVMFAKPSKYRQIIVSFDRPGFPPYEVKQSSDRWAIINVSGDIPLGIMQIYAKP
jgi:hypothetical protein